MVTKSTIAVIIIVSILTLSAAGLGVYYGLLKEEPTPKSDTTDTYESKPSTPSDSGSSSGGWSDTTSGGGGGGYSGGGGGGYSGGGGGGEPDTTEGPETEQLAPKECADSDGGKIYATAGTVTDAAGDESVDHCKDSYFILEEYYCENNAVKATSYDCHSEGKICEAGACVAPNTKDLNNKLGEFFEKEYSGSWPGVTGAAVVDREFLKGGCLKYIGNEELYFCAVDDGRDLPKNEYSDVPKNTVNILKRACQFLGGTWRYEYGRHGFYACSAEKIGKYLYSSDKCNSNGPSLYWGTDGGCWDAGGKPISNSCYDDKSVKMGYCEVLTDSCTYVIRGCEATDKCVNGKCVAATGGTSASAPKPTCIDSDYGAEKSTKGTCTDATGSYTDTCKNTNELTEYYCGAKGCTQKTINILTNEGCANGIIAEAGRFGSKLAWCKDSDSYMGSYDVLNVGTCTDAGGAKLVDKHGPDHTGSQSYFSNWIYESKCEPTTNRCYYFASSCPSMHKGSYFGTCQVPRSTYPQCSDSDAAANPMVYGQCYGTLNGKNFNSEDTCYNGKVREGSCIMGGSLSDLACPAGTSCSKGACVGSGGSTQTPGAAPAQQKCVDGDSNLGAPAKQIFAKNTATYYVEGVKKVITDWCPSSGYINEAYCKDEYSGAFYTQACPTNYKCVSALGACVFAIDCIDNDAKLPVNSNLVASDVSWTESTSLPAASWTRTPDGCASANVAGEVVCPANTKPSTCPTGYTCSKGACVKPTATYSTIFGSAPFCVDSDDTVPKPELTPGSCISKAKDKAPQVFPDTCYGTTAAYDYKCEAGICTRSRIACPTGTYCKDGACILTPVAPTGTAVQTVQSPIYKIAQFFRNLFA